MTSDVGTDLETVSAEDQYLRDYLVLWPYVNLSPLAPSDPTSFDWHHTRSGEEITVYTDQQPRGIGFGHPAAMVLGYYTPSCEPGEPDELRVLLLKRCGDQSPCIHAFPTGSAAVSENVVDAATRGFQDAIGIELSAKARAHLALNHWHLLRETHVDATSWVLWTPSLDVICDICDSDFLVETVWLPLRGPFSPDDGLGPPHGDDWLAWPCDDGSLLSPLYEVFGEPPFDYVFGDRCLPLASAHVGIEALLPVDTPPLRHDTEQFFRRRGALLLAKCAVSTATATLPDRPAQTDVLMTAEADLAVVLGDLSEAQMVELESPNSWLRRGERERAAGGSRTAHPGGTISSNKAEATEAFFRRKGRPLPSGNGAAGSASAPPAPAGEPCATVVVAPTAPAPATPITTTLSQAEFDALVPASGPHGVPLPPQFASRTPDAIHCDVLGSALHVHGDCWPIRHALSAFGFGYNDDLELWDAPFSLTTVQTLMSWCVGFINITFSKEVQRRAKRSL